MVVKGATGDAMIQDINNHGTDQSTPAYSGYNIIMINMLNTLYVIVHEARTF